MIQSRPGRMDVHGLSIFTGFDMGAPRLKHDTNAQKFKLQFQKLVSYEGIGDLAAATGVDKSTLRRWWREGTSQPDGVVIGKVAKHFNIADWTEYFFSEAEKPDGLMSQSIVAAPDWLHKALDEAYTTRHADIVLSVITMAAKEFTQTRSSAL